MWVVVVTMVTEGRQERVRDKLRIIDLKYVFYQCTSDD